MLDLATEFQVLPHTQKRELQGVGAALGAWPREGWLQCGRAVGRGGAEEWQRRALALC